MSRMLGFASMAALALGAAASSASGGYRSASTPSHGRLGPYDEGRHIPNDHGPVIDTTPESKRAKRRRLAKSVAA